MARSSTTFKKGTPKPEGSGRKKGQQNKATVDIREAAQLFGQEALGKLVELMREADFETVQYQAAREILDRAYGKSVIPVDATVTHNIIYEPVLDFGQPQQLESSSPEDAVPARISGPARNGSTVDYNGRA